MLETFGWNDRIAALAEDRAGTAARVTRIDRGVYTVMTELGVRATTLAGELKDVHDPTRRPTIGDWVMLDADNVIRDVLPRSSVFLRGDSDKLQAQAVAANVDIVFVVHACDGPPNLRRLERELVLAHQSGAEPVVVLSKIDQCDDVAAFVAQVATCAPGSSVVPTGATIGVGVAALAEYGSGGRTLAFIGASGVGKSTLVNAILGSEVQATGAIREYDGRGRHTTSARSMFPLKSGGVLIDTPGLRSVGMWRSDEGIAAAFQDIEELSSGCRFSDCTHDHEPDCAVRRAVEMGLVDRDRVGNYQLLQAELDQLDDEAEARKRVVKQQQRVASKGQKAMATLRAEDRDKRRDH